MTILIANLLYVGNLKKRIKVVSTECARDCGPYEVKNACQKTQMKAGRWARALNFGEFSGSNYIKKH